MPYNVEPMRRWGRRDCEAVTRYPTSQRAQNLNIRLSPNGV